MFSIIFLVLSYVSEENLDILWSYIYITVNIQPQQFQTLIIISVYT